MIEMDDGRTSSMDIVHDFLKENPYINYTIKELEFELKKLGLGYKQIRNAVRGLQYRDLVIIQRMTEAMNSPFMVTLNTKNRDDSE